MRPVSAMFLTACGVGALLTACADAPTAPFPTQITTRILGVAVSPGETASVAIGDTVTAVTRILGKVSWTVRDTSVLRHLSGGTVIAKAEGASWVVANGIRRRNRGQSDSSLVVVAGPLAGIPDTTLPPIDTLLPPTDTTPPADTTTPPADTTTPPADTTTPPTDTTTPPADTTTPPADTTSPPVDTTTPPADTTTPPVDTTSPPADSTAGWISIYPGESIQAKVNASPAGSTFYLRAGSHVGQTVTPRSGDRFIGEPGAVLNGNGAAIRAFTGTASNVVIRGLVIERYAPGSQKAAVHGGSGWTIEGNEFRNNDGWGLATNHRMRVLRNQFHHNSQLGLGGSGDSVLVEGNEIAYNNHLKTYDYNWEAGGGKFTRTRWLTLRNNHAYDNWGPGLWADIDCLTTLIEGNRVERNAGIGIFVEISYGAVVRHNTATGNGIAETWLNGAGIQVNSSTDVEIYGNTVSGNRNGITATEGLRGSGVLGPHIVKNLWVHDNNVDMSAGGATGAGIYGGASYELFSSTRNIRFDRNAYRLGASATPFAWNERRISEVEWRNLGFDTGGSFTR